MTQWLHIFDWLGPAMFHAAWQGAVLAAVVWLVLWSIGNRIAARWRFVLWSLVLVRLVVPVVPASPVSLFRLLDWRPSTAAPNGVASLRIDQAKGVREARPRPNVVELKTGPSALPLGSETTAMRQPTIATNTANSTASPWSIWRIAGLIWIAGIAGLASRLALQIRSLGRRQRSWRPIADPQILAILVDCRRKLAIHWDVDLRVSPAESSPAVTGIWRPCIVIPESLLTRLESSQLELVLLHELAHVRRRDVLVHWLLIGLRLAYWFNPAVWLVISRMQAERELACDELVLDAAGSPAQQTYGETLMAIVSDSAAPVLTPGLLGAISTSGRLHRRIAMIRDYQKRSRRGTLAALAVLAAVMAVGLTDAPRQTLAQQNEASKKEEAKAAADKSTDDAKKEVAAIVRKLLDPIRVGGQQRFRESQLIFASTIRDLVKIGPDAVPQLIEELDTTQDEWLMRTLGFTLRAIGDKRAVPALIRAIPKTCLSPSSDYGGKIDDVELMAFMREHDFDGTDPFGVSDVFHFCRPVLEIGSALRKLTGQTHGEFEISTVFLNGGDHQQRQERRLYQRCAQRWTEWWEANWKQHVDDEAFSHVSLYVRKDLESSHEFPHGPGVKFAEPSYGMILQSMHEADAEILRPFGNIVFLDLDTHRIGRIPKHLHSPAGTPEKMDEISAWAAREGFDVMGTEYTQPGEKQPHYAIRSLGLTAWQIKTDLWNDIEAELKKPEPLALGTPADGLLAHFDDTKGQYDPKEFATFLFVTREGGYGALFVGAEVTDTGLKPGTPALPAPETERSNVGFIKGRRLSYRLVEDPTK